MDKAETKYEKLKDKVKFTNNDNSMGMGNKEGEGEIMALKAEIEKLKRRDLASSIRRPLRGNDQNHSSSYLVSALSISDLVDSVMSPSLCRFSRCSMYRWKGVSREPHDAYATNS
jgi:hypothetical protein